MFNLTIAQFSPKIGDKKGNLTKMKTIIKEAKQQDSHLVLFPELAVTGYTTSNIVYDLAEPLEGPSVTEMRETCKEQKIHAAVSFIEKSAEKHVYISCALIDDEGEIVGVYRKTHQFDQEKSVFQKGSELPVFETKLGKIGIMICYDLEFPEIARTLRVKGAELILVPLANMKPYESYQAIYTRSRAMENEIPIAICNQAESTGDVEFFGQSLAVDLYGNPLVQLGNDEQIENVTIHLDVPNDQKLNYLRNVRPEIYQLRKEE